MDLDSEIEFDFSRFVILYKSGRVHRLGSTSRKSPGTDAATGVAPKDVVIDAGTGLAARLFLPKGVTEHQKLSVLVYIHGGAFVVQSAFSPRHTSYGYVNALVAAAGVVAVSVEYRLVPEHPIPAAYDDAWAVLYDTPERREDHLYYTLKDARSDYAVAEKAAKEMAAVVFPSSDAVHVHRFVTSDLLCESKLLRSCELR